MAIVTGFTAARMLQIENETIVDANLVGDRLILVTREGTVIDVGSVRGPEGPEGHVPTLADLGITATLPEINKLQGLLPTTAELNYVDGVTSAIQNQINGKAASGHTHDDRYYTEAEMNTLLLGKAGTSHTHTAADLPAPSVTELGTQNLNTMTSTGNFMQSHGTESTLANNYPVPTAGWLEVFNLNSGPGGTAFTMQRYTAYTSAASTPMVYVRRLYNGTWSVWVQVDNQPDITGTAAARTYAAKYPNGDLFCRGEYNFPANAGANQSYVWTFPIAFVGEEPDMKVESNTTVPQNTNTGYSSISLTGVTIQFVRTTSSSTTVTFSARGRWR